MGSGSDLVEGEFESARGALKSALYALAEMIEAWDEEMKELRSLLKNLGEIEQFYNCIGGIIGLKATPNNADSGPPYHIFLHPALGPLWEVTRQKFNGGSISKGSELQIEVAEFLWRDVQLDGSLIVVAENVMGSTRIDKTGELVLQYGHRCGRCKLENVKVLNDGIDWNSGDNIYWKHDVQRFEALKVILHGNAEFEAVDVILQGNHTFEVPSGYSLKITSGNSGLASQLNPIEKDFMDSGSWFWKYHRKDIHVQLELVEL